MVLPLVLAILSLEHYHKHLKHYHEHLEHYHENLEKYHKPVKHYHAHLENWGRGEAIADMLTIKQRPV